MMKTLVSMIRAYSKGNLSDWDRNLNYLSAAYRATPNATTGFTPNFLMLGREVKAPIEVSLGVREPICQSYGEYTHNMLVRLRKAHAIC